MELSTMQARLTIRIPEDLRRRAKAQAAVEGTTLAQVIRKRLEEFAPDWEAIEDAQDLRAAEEVEARIARGEEELRDWAEVDGEPLKGAPVPLGPGDGGEDEVVRAIAIYSYSPSPSTRGRACSLRRTVPPSLLRRTDLPGARCSSIAS
jgi:predicted DNA-binding protein